MNIQAAAAEITARIPELARDCVINRETIICGILHEHQIDHSPVAEPAEKLRDAEPESKGGNS